MYRAQSARGWRPVSRSSACCDRQPLCAASPKSGEIRLRSTDAVAADPIVDPRYRRRPRRRRSVKGLNIVRSSPSRPLRHI